MSEARLDTNPYAAWLTRQLLQTHQHIALKHGKGRDLVLGVGVNYSAKKLYPFVRSIRRFSDCRILLVVDDKPELLAALDAEGCDVLPWRPDFGFDMHLNFGRVEALIRALGRVKGQIDRAWLLDTEDIVVQRDPFRAMPRRGPIFFEEGESITFGSSHWNRAAVVSTLGEASYEVLKDSKVVCSGTVFSDYASAVQYFWLKASLGAAIPIARHSRAGVDQVTTNVIVRRNIFPHQRVAPFDREVAALGFTHDALVLGKNGCLRRHDGSLPTVVHQYDRNRDFLRALQRYYRNRRPRSGFWRRVRRRLFPWRR